MLKDLKQALKSSMAKIVFGIYICLENFKIVCNVGKISKNSSQSAFKQFKNLVKGLSQTDKELTVQWILSYTKIEKKTN